MLNFHVDITVQGGPKCKPKATFLPAILSFMHILPIIAA